MAPGIANWDAIKSYVDNNPLSCTDPTGFDDLDEIVVTASNVLTHVEPGIVAKMGYLLVMENKVFKQEEIEAISAALGDTDAGLTGSEIGHILSVCRMASGHAGETITPKAIIPEGIFGQ
jgi:hypothetical protein